MAEISPTTDSYVYDLSAFHKDVEKVFFSRFLGKAADKDGVAIGRFLSPLGPVLKRRERDDNDRAVDKGTRFVVHRKRWW